MQRVTFSRAWAIVLITLVSAACGGCGKTEQPAPASTPDSTPDAPCGDLKCSAGTPTGTPRGINPTGGVDVTAKEAWPNRNAEPPPLTPQEQADACAIISACKQADDGSPLTDDAIATLTQNCAKGKSPPGAKEERAIPQQDQFERFDFEARAVLAGKHDCASVRAEATKRPAMIVCQEDGCWWESPVPPLPACCQPIPTVTCKGDIATLVTEGLTFTRDCSRAFAKCDEKSSTGCTDRAPVPCDPAGTDVCDGNVKLGCDSEGKVSFHDCARYPGGECVAGDAGVSCTVHDETCDASALGCDASGKLAVCVGGKTVTVDCAALGMGPCDKGHCKGI